MPKAESFLCIVLLNMAETTVGMGPFSPGMVLCGGCYTRIEPRPIVMLPAYMSIAYMSIT